MSEQKDYMIVAKELRAKISSIIKEYQDVLDDIIEAEKSKVAAKKDYEDCLDRGDERAMSVCLLRIKEANEKIGTGPNSRSEFQSKISGLEEEYKALCRISQEHVKAAEAVLERAKEDLKKVNDRNTQISPGIRFELNNLTKLTTQS